VYFSGVLRRLPEQARNEPQHAERIATGFEEAGIQSHGPPKRAAEVRDEFCLQRRGSYWRRRSLGLRRLRIFQRPL
jgi:hypothetical protein